MTGSIPVADITYQPSMSRTAAPSFDLYHCLVSSLIQLLAYPSCSVSSSAVAALQTVQFFRFAVLLNRTTQPSPVLHIKEIRQNVGCKHFIVY